MQGWRIALALTSLAAATVPSAAAFWKSSLPLHVLVQYPLILGAGVLCGAAVARRRPHKQGELRLEGLAAVLLGCFVLSFWMLPRWVDAAVLDALIDAAKGASLVLLVGLPWGWGWYQIGSLARGFLAANGISMLFALGILYRSAPVRLCNAYLLDEQSDLGRGMIIIAGVATSMIAARLIAGDGIRSQRIDMREHAESKP